MNIIIDIGNSKIKLALFKKDEIITKFLFNELNNDVFDYLKTKNLKNSNLIISSVKKIDEKLILKLKEYVKNVILLDDSLKLPIKNNYKDKKTLGYDRIAAAVGANYLSSNDNNLIIDIGTAITIDLVVDNIFMGGNISPGIDIRYKALNNFTDKLPLLNNRENIDFLYGDTTQTSIISGVINGIVYEIQGAIDGFNDKFKNINIFITGGDAFFFDKKIKRSIFVNSNLVLIGLNEILKINV